VAALVVVALVGAAPGYGEERRAGVRSGTRADHRDGVRLASVGFYLGVGGYGGGFYPGFGVYGGGLSLGFGGAASGLYLGLGGYSGGVIVGVGGHGGAPYGYWPGAGAVSLPAYSGSVPVYSGYPYSGVPVTAVPSVVAPLYPSSPPAPLLARPRVEGAGDALGIERVSETILRLTWRGDGARVQEVTLFLADAGQKVLTAQTLRAAPFTALFNVAPGAAYAGLTLHFPDGVKSTTLIPYDATPGAGGLGARRLE
jgi:hypothetical protein